MPPCEPTRTSILYDGARLWLIDWEAAFYNDRYADLAAAINLVASNEADEWAFLERYFGSPATGIQRERLRVMRRLSHIFYTMAFALSAGGTLPDWSQPGSPLAAFHARHGALRDGATKAAYARAHWEALTASTRT